MSIRCSAVIERFSELSENELEAPQAAEVHRHLADCMSCRVRWEDFQSALAGLKSLPSTPVPVGFADRVLLAAGVSSVRQSRPIPWRTAAAAVIAIVLLLIHSEWRHQELESRFVALLDERHEDSRASWLEWSQRAEGNMAAQIAAWSQRAGIEERQFEELRSLAQGNRSQVATFAAELEREVANRELRLSDLRRRIEEVRAEQPREAGSLVTSDAIEARLMSLEAGVSTVETDLRRRLAVLEATFQQFAESAVRKPIGEEEAADSSSPPAVANRPRVGEGLAELAAGKACAVHREKGRYRLEIDWNHPQAVDTLFDLFAHGQSEVRRLALSELDGFFADWRIVVPEAPADRGLLGVMGNLLGREEPPTELDPDERRVQEYRRVWSEQPTDRVRRGRS